MFLFDFTIAASSIPRTDGSFFRFFLVFPSFFLFDLLFALCCFAAGSLVVVVVVALFLLIIRGRLLLLLSRDSEF